MAHRNGCLASNELARLPRPRASGSAGRDRVRHPAFCAREFGFGAPEEAGANERMRTLPRAAISINPYKQRVLAVTKLNDQA